MIRNQTIIIFILLSIEGAILYLSQHPRFKKYFNFLPSVFWIYFLPMLASTVGLIDSKSPIYSVVTQNLLPASLILLLISIDLKAIFCLGKSALLMFFIGSLGIMVGTVTVFLLLKGWVGGQFWSGFGALSASWTGGSANMIAEKEALGTLENVFLPMVIVDTIVPYVWMGILVAMVGFQPIYDRWNRSDRRILDDLNRQSLKTTSAQKHIWRIKKVFIILGLAFLGSLLSRFLAGFLPEIKDTISTYAWMIIIVSTLGLILSATPLRKLEDFGSTKIGYIILYFVLTCIGAKASIANLGAAFLLILAGFGIVFIHAVFLLAGSRLLKAPLFLLVSASQANIGGVASAPVVAAIYEPSLASVGLLLAILGNIVGTYLGILTGQVCKLFAF